MGRTQIVESSRVEERFLEIVAGLWNSGPAFAKTHPYEEPTEPTISEREDETTEEGQEGTEGDRERTE